MKISETKLKGKLSLKRTNAARRGINFTLKLDDMRALYERNMGFCDYTGLEFTAKRKPTIERINDKGGYESGNLCLVCEEANRMKDSLLDKTYVKTFRLHKEHLNILDALRTKITPEYLEHLKNKYRVDMHYNPSTDLYKDYFKDLTQENVESIISASEETIKQEVEQMPQQHTEEQKEEYKLPDDVRIATYYSALAGAAKKTGMEFQITYADFKARFGRRTCSFSGKPLSLDSKFMLVLDNKKPFAKDNVTVVDEEFGHKLTNMSADMGLSVNELAKMFKRLA